jgi:glycosyltransferase involved in cell wall biosynthesis
MPVRVGVDGTSWLNRRGYGRFARNAVGRLVELDPETTYVVYVDDQSAAGVELPDGAVERRVSLRRAPVRAAAAHSSRGAGDVLRLSRAVGRDSLDAFLFPSVYTYFPVFRVPTVVGVHDAIPDSFPELTLPDRRARAFWRLKERLALNRAAGVFTVSQASRAELAKRFGLEPERIELVPEAPDTTFHPRPEEAVEHERVSVGLEPNASYYLFAGGISPHKNLATLVSAYALLSASRADAPALVVVGDLEEDPYLSAAGPLRRQIAETGLEGRVRLPGFVPDETLARLYSGATAVVLPSLAEGFGLPAVEAAACGAPVVLSDIAAHRETLGGAALFFEARDVSALAVQLARVADDPALRSSMSERGRTAVRRLSWDAAAARLRGVIARTARRDRRALG